MTVSRASHVCVVGARLSSFGVGRPMGSAERSVGAERSSDPSVGTSPDGSTVVTAWEELTVDETVPGGAGRTVSLWVKLVKAGVTYGRWAMTYAGDVLQGGDVSVWVSSEWMYVAFQGKDGGIFVYRASHALAAVGAAPTWEPLGTALSPKFPQAGYLDVGWLPNLVGVGVLGVDYLAVVWERTTDELKFNPGKVAALAFVRSDGAGFVVEGAVITMELSGEAYGTDRRFQMSPAVAIGDPSTLWLLGYLPVDVMWMEVTSGGRLPVPGPKDYYDFTVVLTHRRYAWGGACITSY